MRDLIVLDTETTGVDARKDGIIEIAAAKIADGQIVATFQTLVKPTVPLGVTVAVLTGIQPAELIDAPAIAEAGQALLKFAGDLPIAGHNISFDLDFLKAGGINLPGRSLDTLDLAIVILPKLPFHSMQFLCQHYQFKNQPSHRAMSDVNATVELINLLIGKTQQAPAPILQKIRRLIPRSDWEWSWVFDENNSWQSSAPAHSPSFWGAPGATPWPFKPGTGKPESYKSNRYDPERGPAVAKASVFASATPDKMAGRQDDGKGVDWKNIKPGFNVYELSPQFPQLPVNISLAQADEKSVLVVSNDIFYKHNWREMNLQPQFPTTVQLDADRWEFLLGKDKLKSTELKLIIKVLLTGYPHKPFNPDDTYLTRDEFYLWGQKLAPFYPTPTDLPPRAVMNFTTFAEVLSVRADILSNRHIYLPQWTEFDEWANIAATKILSEPYLHAAVASRRDFVHDVVTDNKTADELFKTLNNFGSSLQELWKSFEDLWDSVADQQTSEISPLLIRTATGKLVSSYAKEAVELLDSFLTKIQGLPDSIAKAHQIEHTQKLLDYLKCLVAPSAAAKIYLTGYAERITVFIIKQPLPNVWQTIAPLPIVIASNGLLVDGRSDFVARVLGQATEVGLIMGEGSAVVDKQIILTPDLPERKDAIYQFAIFDYLKNKLLRANERVLVVFSNQAQLAEFFESNFGQIEGVELISQNVAGNVEILQSKLVEKNGFALLINNNSLPKFLPVVEKLDKVIFLTLPFDPPGTLGQVIAKDRFKDEFSDYGLPRTIIKFKGYLAELYWKTNRIWILDSRLAKTEWGRVVPRSLSGFHITEI
ncbi:MAG: exonuclease domain-containing protein [Patescibacteria group bacterium]